MGAREIDITLVAGRRPELLERTLQSFSERVFPNFQISQIFANIDPFMGVAKDGEKCRNIVLHHFPNAEISMPEKPGFGLAVKNLWSKISAPFALHLEDDWIVLENVTPKQVFPLFEGRVRMATMFTPIEMKYRKFRRGRYKTIRKRIPYTPFRAKRPYFTLSPCFVEQTFAHEYASLLNPDLDPEAQNYLRGDYYNRNLFKYCGRFQNALIKAKNGFILTVDIGRTYRDENNIVKKNSNGCSIWVEQSPK